MNANEIRFLGWTDEETACDLCGRTELKSTEAIVGVVPFTSPIGVSYLDETRFTVAVLGTAQVVLYPVNVPGWSVVRMSLENFARLFRNLDRSPVQVA
jgi:hypothetical protein